MENIEGYIVEHGFKTVEDALNYIFSNPYMKNYFWRYDIIKCEEDMLYGVTYNRYSNETGNSVWLPFFTWDEAISWACDRMANPVSNLVQGFDFEDDIYQIDMTKSVI